MLLEKLRIYLGHQKHLCHYLISESFLQENPIKQNSPELEWLRHPHEKKKKETFFLTDLVTFLYSPYSKNHSEEHDYFFLLCK